MHFFIVGAPRCGTTALSRYLKARDDVCFAKPKEPQYFATTDFGGLTPAELEAKIRRDYLDRFFHPDTMAAQAYGEGSVSYLYSADAIRTILDWRPDARFIVMLRDPLAMILSYHARLYYLLDEDEADFNTAWRLQDERAAGRRIPGTCRDSNMLQYGEVARLGAYTRQLIDIAGGDRVLPLLHDDLRRDPGDVYRRAVEFIGLPDDGRTEFPRVRASSSFRSRTLQRFLQRPPEGLIRMAMTTNGGGKTPGHGLGGTDGKASRGRISLNPRKLRKRLLAWNTVDRPRGSLSDTTVTDIRNCLEADVADLAHLIDRDLSHWLHDGITEDNQGHRAAA